MLSLGAASSAPPAALPPAGTSASPATASGGTAPQSTAPTGAPLPQPDGGFGCPDCPDPFEDVIKKLGEVAALVLKMKVPKIIELLAEGHPRALSFPRSVGKHSAHWLLVGFDVMSPHRVWELTIQT